VANNVTTRSTSAKHTSNAATLNYSLTIPVDSCEPILKLFRNIAWKFTNLHSFGFPESPRYARFMLQISAECRHGSLD